MGSALVAATLLLLGSLGAVVAGAEAQTAARTARVGYLTDASGPGTTGTNFDAFLHRMRELGWVEGKNLVIEHSTAEGIPARAAELVARRVDVIVTAPVATESVMAATTTIPIVFITGADPVAARLVKSLARPGANVTGVTTLSTELESKRLGLLKEAMPNLKRVAILIRADRPAPDPILAAAERGAQSLGLALVKVDAREHDLDSAMSAIRRGGAEAFTVAGAGASVPLRAHARLAELALKGRLPAVAPWRQFAEAGGLMSYGANGPEMFRRAAVQVDRILKGARAGDLPVEQASKFEMVVNVKTAKALGLTIPQPVLLRADQVLE